VLHTESSKTMAHFDRFDICAAWNLYLQHHWAGQTDPMYARHCKLRAKSTQLVGGMGFKPSRSEEFVSGLSENALEIYTALCARAGTLERVEHPIANTQGCNDSLYLMWAGDHHPTYVYVWADSFESAFEEFVEWLDDNAPGLLVSHEDAKRAFEEYCAENDVSEDDLEDDDGEIYTAMEEANEWTSIGHTSLKTGGHIASHEWGGSEVTDSDEVLMASTEAYAEHFQALDRAVAIEECERELTQYSADGTQALSPSGAVSEYWASNAAKYRHCALVTLLCKGVS